MLKMLKQNKLPIKTKFVRKEVEAQPAEETDKDGE